MVSFFLTIHLLGFDYHLKPYTISKGINCFFGIPSKVSRENGGNMINCCYIETSEGYVVIDSGPTYQYAQDTYTIMENMKKIPVKYVINTSAEEEHVLGNSFFKEQGAILIGPVAYKKKFNEKKSLSIVSKLSLDITSHTKLIPLDKYIDLTDSQLKVGTLTMTIKHVPKDNEHLVVHLPSKNIIFAGDMIFNNRIVPFKNNRSLLVWEKGLKLLESLSWIDIISSHGYMTRRSALKNTQSYLSLLKDEIVSSINNGQTKEEAIRSIRLSSFSEDRLYSFWHPQNVATVYDEFKHKRISSVKQFKTFKEKENKILTKSKIISKVKKMVPKVAYVDFKTATKRAEEEKKIIFIKVRSTTCKYCDELDSVIRSNNKVKKILNRYFEVVSVNTDYNNLPIDIRISSTPTLLFLRPYAVEPLMNLTGIRALGEFYSILKELVNDGHQGGYLKP
jgi:glyoxylase-like metal-dependent hydrolase (beta-lactamase superfamily II)/thioredoxin-related protein